MTHNRKGKKKDQKAKKDKKAKKTAEAAQKHTPKDEELQSTESEEVSPIAESHEPSAPSVSTAFSVVNPSISKASSADLRHIQFGGLPPISMRHRETDMGDAAKPQPSPRDVKVETWRKDQYLSQQENAAPVLPQEWGTSNPEGASRGPYLSRSRTDQGLGQPRRVSSLASRPADQQAKEQEPKEQKALRSGPTLSTAMPSRLEHGNPPVSEASEQPVFSFPTLYYDPTETYHAMPLKDAFHMPPLPFDGANLEGLQAQSWIWRFGHFCRHAKVPRDEWHLLAGQYLRGYAFIWYHNLLPPIFRINKEESLWNDFCVQFVFHFEDRRLTGEELHDLNGVEPQRPDESLAQYVRRFVPKTVLFGAHTPIDPPAQGERMRKFIAGLKEPLRARVEDYWPKSLPAAINAAYHAESAPSH